MDPREAAGHLLRNIKDAARPVLAQGRDAVVSVILDGRMPGNIIEVGARISAAVL